VTLTEKLLLLIRLNAFVEFGGTLPSMSLPVPLQSFLQDLGQAWKAKNQDPEHLASVIRGDSSDYTQLQSSLKQVSEKNWLIESSPCPKIQLY